MDREQNVSSLLTSTSVWFVAKSEGGRCCYRWQICLPRLHPGPPFTSVLVDTFGPWHVIIRRTRGGHANSKSCAILFTCLNTRAAHIEVIEEMSSFSFIKALRRSISIRGNVKTFRSDRGTSFVGASDSLKVDVINVEDKLVKNMFNKGTT